MQFSVKWLVYIHIQKGASAYCWISAFIFSGALSVGKVVNAFGHANELPIDTTQFETKTVPAQWYPPLFSETVQNLNGLLTTPLVQTCQIIWTI